MVTNFLTVCIGVGLLALLLSFITKSTLVLHTDHSHIYRMAPAVLVVIAVASLGVAGLTYIVHGALTGDFHLQV